MSLCCDQRSELFIENIIVSYHHGPTRWGRNNEESTAKDRDQHIQIMHTINSDYLPRVLSCSRNAKKQKRPLFSKVVPKQKTSQITRSGHLSRYKTTKALFPKGISFPFVPVQPRRVCHSSLVPFHTMCSVASCEEPYGQYPVSLFSS
jgi:hypothetical protein